MRKTGFYIGIVVLIILVFAIYSAFNLNNGANYNADKINLKVIDGDTFEFNGEIIRLRCVNTPEKGKEGYNDAKEFF